MDGKEILDNTGVHPESYTAAEGLLATLGLTKQEIVGEQGIKLRTMIKLKGRKVTDLANELSVGEPTLNDIIDELEKPGRDPRQSLDGPILKSDVMELTDLKPGMKLRGTVRNVIDFGAFVDIGVHQDGLVHISKLSKKYVKHPLEVVSVGDIVDVTVMEVNVEKKRIGLSMVD